MSEKRGQDQFVREAETWLRFFGSEYVATISGIEVIELRPYISMPYYSGGSLADLIAKGPLAVDRVAELTTQILFGLHHVCFREALVHQDLKPANILLGDRGQAQIADFGLARSILQRTRLYTAGEIDLIETTRPGVAGTLPYMAPELFQAKPVVSTRVDVYALGLIIFEMIVGHRAFVTMDDIRDRRIADWSTFVRRSPACIAQFVEHCIAPNPAARLSNMDEASRAWDKCIATGIGDHESYSSVSHQTGSDDRVRIADTLVAAHWAQEFRPQAYGGVHVSIRTTEHMWWRQASEFRKLNRPREAIEVLQKLFGGYDTPNHRFDDVWHEEDREPLKRGDKTGGVQWSFRLSRSQLVSALEAYLASIADLYHDRHQLEPNELSSHLRFVRSLLQRGGPSFKVTELCGQILLAQGNGAEAIDAFLDSLELAPRGTPSILACLLAAYHATGNRNSLENIAYKFVFPELENVNAAIAQRTCAMAMQMLLRFEDALEFYRRSIAIELNDPGVLKQACICALNTKRFDEAAEFRDALARLAPNSWHLTELTRVLAQVGR